MESIKIKKKFDYKGIELRIVERLENYMNSKDLIPVVRVLAPNGGVIPIQIMHKQTLKSIVEKTISVLDSFAVRGANVYHELVNKNKVVYIGTTQTIGVVIDSGKDEIGEWFRTDSCGVRAKFELIFLDNKAEFEKCVNQLKPHISPSTNETIKTIFKN